MNDFLYNNYHLVYRLFIALSVAIGLVCYKKYKNTKAIYFIWFLIYIFLFELLAGYPSYLNNFESLSGLKDVFQGTVFEKNYWVYNLFWNVLGTVFLSFYYVKNIDNKTYKSIINIITILFILFSIIYLSINNEEFFNRSSVTIKLFAASVIILNVMFYLIEILNGESILSFYKIFNFYISAALLIWWLVTTPVVFYQSYFDAVDWNFILLRWQIFLFANIFMYSTFAFALVYCQPEIPNNK